MATKQARDEITVAAGRYVQAGLSIIGVPAGLKFPEGSAWKSYQQHAAPWATVARWTKSGQQIAIICGAVSGGMEVIDFDTDPVGATRLAEWKNLIGDELFNHLAVQRTGGGGYHAAYRYETDGERDGNLKLAWTPDETEQSGRSILIETRGEGGLIMAAPSVHPSGNYYKMIAGEFSDLPAVSTEERDRMLQAARSLCEAPFTRQQIEQMERAKNLPARPARREHDNADQPSVIDAYNARNDIRAELRSYGYTEAHGSRMVRPNGTSGSVVIDTGQNKSFHHSSNDHLCDGYWHDPFSVRCILRRGSDDRSVQCEMVKEIASDLGMQFAPIVYGRSEQAVTERPDEAGENQRAAPVAPKEVKTQHILEALDWLGYTLRYNEMTDMVEANSKSLDDTEDAKIHIQLRDLGYKNDKFIDQVILARAAEQRYHPLKNYLRSLKWDGQPRFDILASYFEHQHAPIRDRNGRETDVMALYSKRWFVGAVAKALDGEQNVMLVLDGPQDIGKSHFFKWTASGVGSQYYTEDPIDPDSNDCQFKQTELLIWEAGELGATTKRHDVEALKLFITKRQIVGRRPYAKRPIIKQSVVSFAGTVNGDGGGFLNDPTGSRRYMVVEIKSINHGYANDIDINQMWAEAVHLYRNGEPWRLEGVEAEVRNQINGKHQMVDPFVEYISKWFDVVPTSQEMCMSVTDIHRELVDRGAISLAGNTEMTISKLGRALKTIGVERRQRRVGGKPAWFYMGVGKKQY